MDAASLRQWRDGYPVRLSASEWLAWAKITCETVRPEEWEVLRQMDMAHASALSAELSDQRARDADQAKPKGRR